MNYILIYLIKKKIYKIFIPNISRLYRKDLVQPELDLGNKIKKSFHLQTLKT